MYIAPNGERKVDPGDLTPKQVRRLRGSRGAKRREADAVTPMTPDVARAVDLLIAGMTGPAVVNIDAACVAGLAHITVAFGRVLFNEDDDKLVEVLREMAEAVSTDGR